MDHRLSQYRVLEQEGNAEHPDSFSADGLEGYEYLPRAQAGRPATFWRALISVSLFTSLLLNVILLWRVNAQSQGHDRSSRSLYGKIGFR